MKKHIPFVVLCLFILAMLSLCLPVLRQQQAAEAQRAYEAERHLVVFSDLPQDVNDSLSQAFYQETNMRVQILSREDGAMRQSLAAQERQPDILIASSGTLQEEKKQGLLQPYASPATDKVPDNLRDADNQWTGLWVDPMVFVLSQEYYERRGMQVQTWDDLLTDPQLRIVFPDLGATDLAGDFLCSFVEIHGREDSQRYLQTLQTHISSYAKSMAANVRRAAGGEVDIGVADAATARQYRHDGAPIYLLYPQDGTSYWLTGIAVTNWCSDGELASAFVNWLYSDKADQILQQQHIFLTKADKLDVQVDAKGQHLQLFPVKKQYTDAGRRSLQEWWIKSVRFGKDS